MSSESDTELIDSSILASPAETVALLVPSLVSIRSSLQDQRGVAAGGHVTELLAGVAHVHCPRVSRLLLREGVLAAAGVDLRLL